VTLRLALAVGAVALTVAAVLAVNRCSRGPDAPMMLELPLQSKEANLSDAPPSDLRTAPSAAPPPVAKAPGEGDLLAAIRAADFATLQRLLSEGHSPDVVDGDGRSALAIALELQQFDSVRLLLDAGASLETASGVDPLLVVAIRAGDRVVAEELLQRGAAVNAKDAAQPLVTAIVEEMDVQFIETLVAAGANVNASDADGETSLAAAVRAGHGEVAALLLQHGARADAAGSDGLTPVQIAVEAGDEEMAELLYASGGLK